MAEWIVETLNETVDLKLEAFIVLHVFIKKTQKTPSRSMLIAVKRAKVAKLL